MDRLKDKVALITGGSRGLGKAIAEKFLHEGAKVVLSDIHEERLGETVSELGALGNVFGVFGDVTSREDAERMVQATVDRFSQIDIAVNNAGLVLFESFLEHSDAGWDRVIDVDLKGVFLVSQAAAQQMQRQGRGGVILNQASKNGLSSEPHLAAYNAAKAGVVLLTKTMAVELAQYQIRVNAVCPGFILTDLARDGGADEQWIADYVQKIPLGRPGQPSDVANLFAFLASDEASFITGAAMVIDGGQTARH